MGKKKILPLVMAAAMCAGLAGCAMPGSGPKDAAEVVAKYVERMEEEDSYHVDMEMSFQVGVKAEGVAVDLPVELGMSADVYGGNVHGDMEMSMEFMGMDMEQTSEIYVVSGKKGTTTYTYDSDNGYWTVSEEEDDGTTGMLTGLSALNVKSFKDAGLEKDKKGNYVVTQTFGDFMKAGDVYDNMEEFYESMSQLMSVDSDEVLDEWKDAEVVYVFDRDFRLLSVDIEGCEYSGTMEEDGVKAKVSVSLELGFEFSKYGEIDEDDVEVPKKVKENAVPSVTIELDPHMTGEWDPEFPEVDGPGTDEPYEPAIGPGTDTPVHVIMPSAAADDTFGSYAGVNLSGKGDSWDASFGADGWVFDNEDGEYTFMSTANPKYPDVTLYVYNAERRDTTRADILEKGIWGYDIDTYWADEYPSMTWGGLTWGASAEDVISVYGQAGYVYEGSMYTSYEYTLGQMEIEFYVYPEEGLREVSVSYYDWY